MIPTELVGTAQVPGSQGQLRCYRHDGAFTFRIDGTELMSSRVYGSEQELAELSLQRLGPRPAPR
ncbi:MAG: spermidine synthase, partial [Planctomycetota bacterium]